MRVPVAPFLKPQDETLVHRGWAIIGDGENEQLPADIVHWDYQTTLHFAGGLSVDRRAVTEQSGLEFESELRILVFALSSATRVRRVVLSVDVPVRDHYELELEFVLDGSDMGGRLSLETCLVASDPKARSGIAPNQAGSILWRTVHHTHLEGSGAQFPTDAEDFEVTRKQFSEAAWALRIDTSDMSALFASAVRLTLNSSSPAIQKLLKGSKDAASLALARYMEADVTRQLVSIALASEDVHSEDLGADPETLAGALRMLLNQLWPNTDVATIAGWRLDDPSRIELRVQHLRRIGI